MDINTISDGEKLTLAISGRLDTNSSPKLEAELRQSVNGVTELVSESVRSRWLRLTDSRLATGDCVRTRSCIVFLTNTSLRSRVIHTVLTRLRALS